MFSSLPPFFPATMLLLKAGKKGGKKNRLSDVEISAGFPSPSLLPGHYAIIKGREEGRAGNSFIKTTTDISLSIPRFLCYL